MLQALQVPVGILGALSHGGGLENPWTYLALVALVGSVLLFRLAVTSERSKHR